MQFLLSGRMLRQYKVLKVLGSGGFGVTYLARDETLRRLVALKEFYPQEIAFRSGVSIKPKSGRTNDFSRTKEGFVAEAQIQARFDHDHIVKVLQVFEANNTAYIVQEYESGRDLKAWFAEIDDAPTQVELDCVLEPLLHALDLVHRNDVLHRDIAPDNILIRDNGEPVLLDFGAAKDVVAQHTENIAAFVKAGYSPPEFYSSRGRRQGPWSDIYSLAAVMYRAVRGEPPPEAAERLLNDNLTPVRQGIKGEYRAAFLDAIEWGLKLPVHERPQNTADWRPALFAEGEPTRVTIADSITAPPPEPPPPSATETAPSVGKPVAWATMLAALKAKRTATSLAIVVVIAAIVFLAWRDRIGAAISEWAPPSLGSNARIRAEEAKIFAAAFQDRVKLQTYLNTCKICAGKADAQGQIETIRRLEDDANEEKKVYMAAYQNLAKLQAYLNTCKICELKSDAQSQIDAIRRYDDQVRRAEREASFYRAAKGDPGLLRRYLAECQICANRYAAESEAKLAEEEAGYRAARGSVVALDHYLRECKTCAFQDAARTELAALQKSAEQKRAAEENAAKSPFWEYNGSTLKIETGGDTSKRKVLIDVPSPTLQRQGVRRGAVLFDGVRDGKKYRGKAYAFSPNCDPVAYDAQGDISDDDRAVTITGRAPKLSVACRVFAYQDETLNLAFHDQLDNWGQKP